MSVLDSILPEYVKISEAPTLDKIKKEAELKQVDLSDAIREESTRKYKAITDPGTPSAAVWLVSNPALMAYQYEMGAKTLTRKPPQLVASGQKAIDGLSKKRTNSKFDGNNQDETYTQKD